MKKIVLLFGSAIMVSWVFSQSLELYYEGEPIDPMTEITLTAHPDSGMMIIDTLDMENPDDNVIVFVNYDASDPSSVQEIDLRFTLSKAYPNPANNFVSVDYDLRDVQNARIAFYNLLGSNVNEIELTESSGTLSINTSDFIEGIYFYSLLINNEASQTQKLIIKH